MNLKEAIAKLEPLGDKNRREWNVKNGAGKPRLSASRRAISARSPD